MELYVNPQITGFRQEVDGTIKELKIGSNKEDAYENIIEQGADAKLEKNKTATINVSTYTEPVEVLPTSGKDGMKKVTVSLSNMPAGTNMLYAWRVTETGYDPVHYYLNIDTAQESPSDIKMIGGDIYELEINSLVFGSATYTKVSDTEFTLSWETLGQTRTQTFTRDATKDVTLWQVNS